MFRERLVHGVTVCDVSLDESDAWVVEHTGQVQQASRVRELVDNDDFRWPARKNVTNEVRPDESGSAGDENGIRANQRPPPGTAAPV